jgi:ABC-type transport system involved in multi-copper enzyme maturation permease subunit
VTGEVAAGDTTTARLAVTPTAAGARPRPRLLTVVVYTLRSCLPPRRWAAVLGACAGAVLLGLLARAVYRNVESGFANVAAEGIFGLMVPIAALIIGDAVLGAELRAGTFHFTWRSPGPTWELVLGRWAGGSLVALVTIAPACALAAIAAGTPGRAWPAFVAGTAEALSYIAVFLAIACVSRRTAVWSLAFVFLVERLLGTALTGIAQLSPTWESRAVFVGLVDFDVPNRLVREGIPQGVGAIVRLAIVSAVAMGIATWRMRHLRLAGASD